MGISKSCFNYICSSNRLSCKLGGITFDQLPVSVYRNCEKAHTDTKSRDQHARTQAVHREARPNAQVRRIHGKRRK
eukprot:6043063-Pleurochrysis_carterae.AAC.1